MLNECMQILQHPPGHIQQPHIRVWQLQKVGYFQFRWVYFHQRTIEDPALLRRSQIGHGDRGSNRYIPRKLLSHRVQYQQHDGGVVYVRWRSRKFAGTFSSLSLLLILKRHFY